MSDLYAVLGVARDADLATIRRAFRKKVRNAHPDGGGSAEAFEELKSAYDILSDPIRRRRYDETGDVGDPAADPRRAKIIEVLSFGLDQALVRLGKVPQVRRNADLIRLMTEVLSEGRVELFVQKGQFEMARDNARWLEDRFLVMEGENLMQPVIASRISSCEKQIAFLTERVALIDEALVFLQKARFDSPLELTSDMRGFNPLLDLSSLVGFK
ncbi:MAG: J domain-containing protein [Methylocystis sp.]